MGSPAGHEQPGQIGTMNVTPVGDVGAVELRTSSGQEAQQVRYADLGGHGRAAVVATPISSNVEANVTLARSALTAARQTQGRAAGATKFINRIRNDGGGAALNWP